MYVSPSSDELYGAPKKKARPEPRLEDYADFVADVEDGELDAFATPSYGRTRLTRDDEALVEELATKKEKTVRQKRAPKPLADDEAQEREAIEREARKAARRDEREKREKREKCEKCEKKEKNEKSGKRSFLSKIKEAIATGAVSSDADERSTRLESGDGAAVSTKKMRWLRQKATKFLEENGRTLELDGSASQAEELAALLEATLKAATGAAPEERSAKARERRPARTLEEIFVDEPTFDVENADDERDAKPSKKPRRTEKTERSEKLEKTEFLEKSEKTEKREERRSRREDEVREEAKATKRKSAAPDWNDFDDSDDDYDPIAFWERLAADEDDEEDETPVARPSAERPKKRRETPDDFEDWSDEVAAKKKSARIRERTENEPIFETAPTSRLSGRGAGTEADAADEDASCEFDGSAGFAVDAGFDGDAETEPRSKKRRSKKRRRDGESAEDGDDGGPAASAKKCPNCEKKAASKGLERFGELTLTKPTLRALAQMGYAEPTPIQAGTIPRIQAGVDLMGQAKTGTGKTAAFMIPIVEFVDECEPVDARIPSPLALVVLPTRELAVQVRDETNRLAQFRDLKVVACYGGKPIASQVEKLRRGCDILVGTPGRIIDLANRGALSLGKARWVVLDEADRMLDVGFRPDVERILRMTPSSRQTLLFSATLAPPVVRLAKAYMRDPESHDFSQKNVSADTIEQFYLTVDQGRKFDALVKLLELQQPRQAIVFCRTKRCVDMIGRRLEARFPGVDAIHGDLAQTKRDRIMSNFRQEKTKILVATDVVGRGIDVSSVSHIVNYDVPQYCDDYVHRVGRAGRMGREGVAFTLVTAAEGAELTRIEIRIDRLLERMELPGFEAYSKPVEGPGSSAEPERFERKPVFGKTIRRARRAL